MQNQFEPSWQTAAKGIVVRLGALTDAGRVRGLNEDNFLICPDLAAKEWLLAESPFSLSEAGCLLAVADGMGGENAGEVASGLAVAAIQEFFSAPQFVMPPVETINHVLTESLLFAHTKIVNHANNYPECEGMGTTILLVWVVNRQAWIAWSGDSRCYLYREREGLSILSTDHSVVWELVLNGQLHPDEAENHPESHIITQNLGDRRHPPQPDVFVQPLQPGDKLLLCSDGLNGMLPSKTIENLLQRKQTPADICRSLVEAANGNGGEDNITVVLLEVLNGLSDPETTGQEAVRNNERRVQETNEWLPDATSSEAIAYKTYKTQRRTPPPTPTGPKKITLFVAGFGLVLLVTGLFFFKGVPTASTSGSRPRAETPQTQSTFPEKHPIAPEVRISAAPFSLPEEKASNLSRETRSLLNRYTAVAKKIEGLTVRPGGGPIPNRAALDSAVYSLPGYRQIRKLRSTAQLQQWLKKELNTHAALSTFESRLRQLKAEVEDLEAKLR